MNVVKFLEDVVATTTPATHWVSFNFSAWEQILVGGSDLQEVFIDLISPF